MSTSKCSLSSKLVEIGLGQLTRVMAHLFMAFIEAFFIAVFIASIGAGAAGAAAIFMALIALFTAMVHDD